MPPGLTQISAHFVHADTCRPLITESHLRRTYSGYPFLIALRSPFPNHISTTLTPAGGSLQETMEGYSLFLNGFWYYTTVAFPLSSIKHKGGIRLPYRNSKISLQSLSTRSGLSSDDSKICHVVSPLITSIVVVPAFKPDLTSV